MLPAKMPMLHKLRTGPAQNGASAGNGAPDFTRALLAEALGAGVLSFCVVAAGVLGERFAGGNIGLAMLMTALAGAGAFLALTLTLAASAPHYFNPAVTLAATAGGRVGLLHGTLTAAAQLAAAGLGAMIAHLVTNTGLVQVATQVQTGAGLWAGEFAATAVFAAVLVLAGRHAHWRAGVAGAFTLLAISLATPSMSFANPALTLARALTDSFTSIRLEDAGIIGACQFFGALAGVFAARWFAREA